MVQRGQRQRDAGRGRRRGLGREPLQRNAAALLAT